MKRACNSQKCIRAGEAGPGAGVEFAGRGVAGCTGCGVWRWCGVGLSWLRPFGELLGASELPGVPMNGQGRRFDVPSLLLDCQGVLAHTRARVHAHTSASHRPLESFLLRPWNSHLQTPPPLPLLPALPLPPASPVQAASTTTWTTWARTCTTTPSSRCWATGPSATTSRRRPSAGPGSCSPRWAGGGAGGSRHGRRSEQTT